MQLFGKPKKEDQMPPPPGPYDMPPPPDPNFQQPYQEQAYPSQGYPQQQPYDPYAPQQQPMQQVQQQPEPQPVDHERIEEVAEAIIDEKWNDLLKDINKMVEWKERAESRIVRIEQDIENLKSNFDSLHKGILGKISEYDENLTNVGTEIKAMEKVFQKILPTLTDNVNKLSRLTKR
ncbi:MAG TPA: hypothetical protein VJH97_01085 [Candidatus Nanoarchaeia archaeon]|nr:hypothetical protein [Candidatus Nanoarchaeia archaeon]